MRKYLLSIIVTAATVFNAKAQCHFIPSTSTTTDTLSYSFSGGSFQSYGCMPIDPTYWLSGNGNSVTVTFVNPESYPSFRVWGMNSDDTATVSVNAVSYPLTSLSASYNTKVVCGISPGPNGVIFSGGNLTGANSNNQGNYSYQDVQLNITNVTSLTITGIHGAGWGFAGISVNCPPLSININDSYVNNETVAFYPNPTSNTINFSAQVNVQLTNAIGQIITDRKNVTTLDLTDQSSGIYFILLTNNKGQVVQRSKIVKK
jgi:Secretion system C-terminal sorting domain